MGMRELFRRFAARIAPEACAFCEGGSGMVAGKQPGTLRRCEHCDGTGLARTSRADLQNRIRSRFRRRAGRPRNAA